MGNFFGKFRGIVVENNDPLMQGRLRTLVPAISDLPLIWALPCVPYAGKNVGFFAIPPVGANVWVEFEGGNPDYPIWAGCFWGSWDMPAEPAVPTSKVIKTETATLEINDLLGSVSLEVLTSKGPVIFALGSDGITVTIGGLSQNLAPGSA
jgi:hypothetical protein